MRLPAARDEPEQQVGRQPGLLHEAVVHGGEAGAGDDAGRVSAGDDAGRVSADAGAGDGVAYDAGGWPDGGPPGPACRPFALECLDATPTNVIEVPTELTLARALAEAHPGDTVQVRAGVLDHIERVPPYVTLRGCEGARLEGALAFAGSAGTIEGFEVTGTVVANATGTYIVRRNRFAGAITEAGVSVRAVDGIVTAQITALVEDNLFASRVRGFEARTYYDTGVRTLDVTPHRLESYDALTRPDPDDAE